MADPGQASPFPVADGQRDLDRLSAAGFNAADLVQYRDETTQKLMAAGFGPDEISKHWGYPPDRLKALDLHIQGNIDNLPQEQKEEVTSDPIKLLRAGFQNSTLGLMSGHLPNITMAPETGHLGKIAAAVGQMAGDVPAMLMGAGVGAGLAGTATSETGPGAAIGALAGAGAGAAMFPEAMRQIMIDAMRKGEMHSSTEFAQLAAASTWETMKAGIAGAIGGVAGGVAGRAVTGAVGGRLGETAGGLTNAAANVASFSAAAAALDGKPVNAGDFIDGAFIALATHAAVHAMAPKGAEATASRIEPTPPPKPGTVRFFHGADEGADFSSGPRWVTPNPDYAANFRGPKEVHYVDVPKGHPAEVAARDWDEIDEAGKTNSVGRYKSVELPEEFTSKFKPYNPGTAPTGFVAMPKDSFSGAMDHIQTNLENLYVKTGMHPMEIVSQAKTDKVLMDELMSQTAAGQTLAPNLDALAPPEPAPNHALSKEEIASQFPGHPGREYRMDDVGKVSETLSEIQSHLKQIGEKMGFSVRVGPSIDEGGEDAFQSSRFVRGPDGTIRMEGGVYVHEDPEETYHRWYGLSKTEILWHEIGHAIDSRIISGAGTIHSNPNFGQAAKEHQPEPIRLEMEMASRNFKPWLWKAQPEHNGKPQELMADAIAVWISDPTAAAKMPEFTKKFGDVLEPLKKIANKAVPERVPNKEWTTDEQWKEEVKEKRERRSEGAAGAGGGGGGPGGNGSTNTTPPGGPGSPRIEGAEAPRISYEASNEIINEHIGELPRRKFIDPDALYRQNVSELGPARNIDKELHNPEKGFNREEHVGLEDMARQTYASGQRASYFIHEGTLDASNPEHITFDRDGPSIVKAFRQAQKEGGTHDGFRNYLLALRTVGRAAQGQETGIAFHVAAENIRGGADKYANAAKIWNDTQRAVLDYARQRGMFSEAQVDAITNSDSFAYITMRRVLGNDAGMRGTTGRTFRARNPLMRMEGSDKQIVDPIVSTVDNIRNIIAQADRNAVAKSVVDLAERKGLNPLPNLKLKQLPEKEATATIAAAGSDHFDPYLPEDIKEAVKPFLAARGVKGKDSEQFVYFRDGKPEVWTASDPYLAQLVRGADSKGEAHVVLEVANKIASFTRAGITSAFDFGTRTALRDQIGTFALDPTHPPPFVGLVRGIMSQLRSDDAYHQWWANGGAGAALTSLDADYISRDLHSIFERTGTWNRMWNTVRHPVEALQLLNERLDAAPRIAYTERQVNAGRTPLKAATMSRQAFLDFAEKGTSEILNQWQRATPFMRPGFLGLNQVAMAVKNHPVQTALYTAAAVTAPTIALYAMNYLMDEYGGLPENLKYRNQDRLYRDMTWMLPPIMGMRIKLSTPPELGFLFKALPERALDAWLRQDKHAFDDWAQKLVESLVPPFIPSIAKPIIEQWGNKSVNTGRQLIPASLEGASGDMQYTEYTSEPAKAVARVLGPSAGLGVMDVSPITIDNYVRQWGGSVPFQIMQAIGLPFKSGGKPWEWSDVPFVQGFMARHPDMNAQPIQDFYTDKKSMETLMHNQELAKKRLKQGADPQEYIRAEQQAFMRTETQVKALNAMHDTILTIQHDDRMKDFERRQFIEQIYGQMIEIAKGGSQMIQQFKEVMKQ